MAPTRQATTRGTSLKRDSAQPYRRKSETRSRAPGSSTPTPAAATANISRSSGLRLMVKAPPSKLRQATTAQHPPNPYAPDQGAGGESGSGRPVRSTRKPKWSVEEEDSDDDDDNDEDHMEGDEAEVDDELIGMTNDEDGDSEEDAEGEEDVDMMEPHPPPPVIRQTVGQGGKSYVTVTASPIASGPMKSVEAQETGNSSSPSLSSLSENDDADLDQTIGNDEDGVDQGSADDLTEDDDEKSRSATPDLSKLTRRQRGLYVPEPETASTSDGAGLVALSNNALKKKVFSEEEHAMRRQEMARRRKVLSEKRGEEEKMETINKLLSKPGPKRRTRAEMFAAQYATDNGKSYGTPNLEDEEVVGFTRYIQNAQGARLGIPSEWLGSEGGKRIFGLQGREFGGRGMVEEVG
ncbi:hypothetical protein LTR56_025756 [Elasticomyces elasticus]|nr:hypothetical protein LTR56_025756 [Elasticomyces elasticus]KAK3622601.1 hypothetical protein LTR22_024726 [Elasticomyces elasticus]KAK4904780.1 hypothetical protein LTR49_025830 [Elasticomyces elasticus]KAK5739352.1 hypothetical protein LTS12_025304 [Elasticomyces elasticus]